MKKWEFRFIVLLLLLGLGILSFPKIHSFFTTIEQKQKIQSFKETISNQSDKDALYKQMKQYNEKIYKEHQKDLKDAWSYSQNTFDLGILNLDMNIIGYIEIPKLDVQIPLFIGANYNNLNKGVAIMSQTSMPIGGENTNCVIAGHRGGYHGEQLFKNIENLAIGDEIRITNPWETLTYFVIKKIVIEPNEIEAVKILPNQDMITLFTCHPYGMETQRYVVYASRKSIYNDIELPKGVTYTSSRKEIAIEKTLNNCLLFASGLLAVILIIESIRMNKM